MDAVVGKGLQKNSESRANCDSESEDKSHVNKPIHTYVRTSSYLTHFFSFVYSHGVKLRTTAFSISDSVYIVYYNDIVLITDSEAYRALENRHDKLARDFIKKEKAKFLSS
jgi:hypothetical protein